MKTACRQDWGRSPRARSVRAFPRWLRVCLRALGELLRGRMRVGRVVWTQDESAERLAAGFPELLAVPEPLFGETAALFPARTRLAAAASEEELLAAIRLVEARCGARFDWDAFLRACERENRRAERIGALSEALRALALPPIDARSPAAALRSLAGEKDP